ncbi:hypothetical protein MNBD_NITROSPINAE02-253 [hydrothermal vent metagenome]|uniref:DUF4124 domain-containing protein n=1 Tax=hydrothermal vent metagenome TaxID=652676 RepID=A0A3B1CJV8_9ZZZZ
MKKIRGRPRWFGVVIVVTFSVTAISADFYKWVDDRGNIHYADSIEGIPSQFRGQTEVKTFKKNRPESTVREQSERGERGHRSPAESKEEKDGLMRIEVKYKAYEGGARRIIIPVTFNGSVTAPMLLDTGAPGLVISPGLAQRLGVFDSDEGRLMTMAAGIGGSVPAVLTIIDSAQVGKAKDRFIPATVTGSISGAFAGLIGMDFLSNFSISIDTRRHVLILEQQPERPNMPAGHDRAWWRINFSQFAQMRAGWKEYSDRFKKLGGKQSSNVAMSKFAKNQYNEANKLFNKLEKYANHHSVPMHWRKY